MTSILRNMHKLEMKTKHQNKKQNEEWPRYHTMPQEWPRRHPQMG
jgi:hypothetical protein